jgi:hypothetical protein
MKINTAPEDRRAMQQLNITDPMAVDAGPRGSRSSVSATTSSI